MPKNKMAANHLKTGRIRPVFESKMAAKAFKNQTQKACGK
jgi:hypothetical protein